MSNDLISRKALSENICNTECKIPNFESESELNAFMLGLNVKQIAVMKCLSDQSTAYAPDKVVERINAIGKSFCKNVECDMDCNDCDHICMMRAIVEKVKDGGVE